MPACVPQLGQKRMFVGTEAPQFAQERIGVWVMNFSTFAAFHGQRVVRLAPLIGHIFAVDNTIFTINHKDSLLEQTPFLEPHSVILPELLTTMGRKRLMKNPLDRLPVSLSIRRIHTDGVDVGTWWETST